jgi:hypothetical protein
VRLGSSAALAVFVLCLASVSAAAYLRKSAQNLAPVPVDIAFDVPPMPEAVAAPLTFGFRSLLADFTFLEAIQLLAQRKGDAPSAATLPLDRRLSNLLSYATNVDPKFAGAYRFAGAALTHETVDGKAMGVLAAVQLLEKGVRERPDEWRIGLSLGFLRAYYLRDYAGAAAALAEAARDPKAPRYLGLLATRMAAQGGELQMATTMAEAMLQHANEEETRREWQDRVNALHMERDLRAIEEAAQRYHGQRGTWPTSVLALVVGGFLAEEPQEPHGGRYVLGPNGEARSTVADRLRVYGGSAGLEVH